MTSEAQPSTPVSEPPPASERPRSSFISKSVLSAAYKRYSGWTHAIAISAAFIADFLHPLGDFSLYLALGATIVAIGLGVWIYRSRVTSELAVAAVILCGVTAVFAGALGAVEHFGNAPDGAFARLMPSVRTLQTDLKILASDKIDKMMETQRKQGEQIEKIATDLSGLQSENQDDSDWAGLQSDDPKLAAILLDAEGALKEANMARVADLLRQAKESTPAPPARNTATAAPTQLAKAEPDVLSGPLFWGTIEEKLGTLLQGRGEAENNVDLLEQAAKAFNAASDVFEMAGATYHAEEARLHLARVQMLLKAKRKTANAGQ